MKSKIVINRNKSNQPTLGTNGETSKQIQMIAHYNNSSIDIEPRKVGNGEEEPLVLDYERQY